MDFGKVLKNAWTIIWAHKVIIWFGFLMMLPSLIMALVMGGFFFFFNEEISAFFYSSSTSVPDINPLFIVLYFVFIFDIMIFSYIMMALSFAGVLKGTLDLKDKEDKISFGELWRATLPYVGRIFGVFFLVAFTISAFLGGFMLLFSLVGAVTAGIAFICLIPLFLLILPLELIAYIFASLAMAAVIVEDLGVFDAIRRAWEVLKQKFWSLVLMGIILLFIQMALNMIIIVPMQIAQFAFMFSVDMTSSMPDPNTFLKPFAILMAVFIPLATLMQGLGLTYANASWMLSYLDITARSPKLEIEGA